MTAAPGWWASAVALWLPGRRWFGGGGSRVEGVEFVRLVDLGPRHRPTGPRGMLGIVAVRVSGPGGTELRHHQLPLALRGDRHGGPGPDDLIGEHDGDLLYDATGDPEVMASLLRAVAEGHRIDGVRFVVDRPQALAFASRAGLPVRRGTAEQSNTSLVFGDRFILKLFRRLDVGVNPDLEVHRRLSGPNLAPLIGAIETSLDAGPVTLGIVQEFVPDAVDGWTLVTGALGAGNGLLTEVRELGAAVAVVHRMLAEEFGAAAPDGAMLAAVRDRMSARLETAVHEVDDAQPYLSRLRTALAPAGRSAGVGPFQRIHGDLHLGQALRTGTGWLLIDFEGEPVVPIADRAVPRSPLQDVAGVLRSLSYAAGHVERLAPERAPWLRRWLPAAREAFLAGYGRAGGTELSGASPVLRAYELDKALYEVVYETRNRPDWVSVPWRAVLESISGS
ncbi:maltokinase N-terminal cap-like domain-containing protein [Micromonospora sp. SCSIO 07396]